MLDYSGTLLHGMRQMGLDDVFDELRYLTRDPRARQAVELCVPKTCATWAYAPRLAVGLIPRVAPGGQVLAWSGVR